MEIQWQVYTLVWSLYVIAWSLPWLGLFSVSFVWMVARPRGRWYSPFWGGGGFIVGNFLALLSGLVPLWYPSAISILWLMWIVVWFLSRRQARQHSGDDIEQSGY